MSFKGKILEEEHLFHFWVSMLVKLISGFEWMCFMVIIRFPTKASVLPDNLLSTEVPLSSGET